MNREEFDEIKLNDEYSVFYTKTKTDVIQPHIRHHLALERTDFPIVANSAAGLMALKLRELTITLRTRISWGTVG